MYIQTYPTMKQTFKTSFSCQSTSRSGYCTEGFGHSNRNHSIYIIILLESYAVTSLP